MVVVDFNRSAVRACSLSQQKGSQVFVLGYHLTLVCCLLLFLNTAKYTKRMWRSKLLENRHSGIVQVWFEKGRSGEKSKDTRRRRPSSRQFATHPKVSNFAEWLLIGAPLIEHSLWSIGFYKFFALSDQDMKETSVRSVTSLTWMLGCFEKGQ